MIVIRSAEPLQWREVAAITAGATLELSTEAEAHIAYARSSMKSSRAAFALMA